MSRRIKQKRPRIIVDLPFKSMLDERPKHEQFILLAWDMNGYCGYESIYWDADNTTCQYGVAWLPLGKAHVFTRNCAQVLRKLNKMPILSWSQHFSAIIDKKYVSNNKLPKVAETI